MRELIELTPRKVILVREAKNQKFVNIEQDFLQIKKYKHPRKTCFLCEDRIFYFFAPA